MFFKNIDGNTTCKITIGAHELCDDGDGRPEVANNNGNYKSSGGAPSYCDQYCGDYNECKTKNPGDYHIKCAYMEASDYNGRIQNGEEYFCGDKVVQHMPNDSCYDSECKPVIKANYPDANISNFIAANKSEECDSDDVSRDHLCDIYMKLNSKSIAPDSSGNRYYESETDTIKCNGCKIATSGTPCGYCGDGVYQSGETCENTEYGIEYAGAAEPFNKKSLKESFTTIGSDTYSIPLTGTYKITVYGAQGGMGIGEDQNGFEACHGAKVWGTFNFNKGDSLNILVGAKGKDAYQDGNYAYGGGGGDASAVKKSDGTLLLVAGGGGGGGWYNKSPYLCTGGQASNNGSPSNDNHSAAATGGADGANGDGNATGGKGINAGWSMKGGDAGANYEEGDGWSSSHHYAYGGGGGGYSGGNAAYSNDYGGGGGGSYKSGTNSDWLSGDSASQTHTGNGEVVIEMVSYAPCKSDCEFETNTSNFVEAGTSKTACQGLSANAEWWNNPAEVTQEFKNGSWTPSEQGEHSATNPGSNVCKYKCKSGYNWNGSACVNKRVIDCSTFATPTTDPETGNWEWNTVDQIVQEWDGSKWDPAETVSYSETPSDSECRFKCKYGYTYDGGQCHNTRTESCPTLPTGAVYNTASSITQNWTPENGWQPANTLTYNDTASTTECRYKCNTHYTWSSSEQKCNADSHSADCTGLIENAVWNTVSSITQTWNGSEWVPSPVGHYNTSASQTECRYKCKSGFHTEDSGSTCVSNERDVNCTGLPAHAHWTSNNGTSKTIHQTWGSSWSPSTSASHNSSTDANQCYFQCNTNYDWNGTQCVAKTQSANCTGLPGNAVWNTASSITQTWNENGSGCDGTNCWYPTTAGSYSTTASTTECRFKCKVGYSWNGSQCQPLFLSWDFESDMPTSNNWVTEVSNKITRYNSGNSNTAIDSMKGWILQSNNGTNGLGNSNGTLPEPHGNKSLCSNSSRYSQGNNTSNYFRYTHADITIKVTVPDYFSSGKLSFYYTGSSQGSYDFLQVYVDPTLPISDASSCSGSCKKSVSGSNTTWKNDISITLTPGEHTIVFRYRKNNKTDSSADRFCIDSLILEPASISCADETLSNALVYLKLDEGSGTTTANSGTLSGSYSLPSTGYSWNSSGHRSKALYFTAGYSNNSATNIINIENYNPYDYYNNFTMMAWVKPSQTITVHDQTNEGTAGTGGQRYGYIFGAGHGGEPANYHAGVGVSVGTNGIVVVAHAASFMPPIASYSGSLSSSSWNHVAVVVRNKVPHIYLNGKLVKTGVTVPKNLFPSNQIGGGAWGAYYGYIDDVRIIGTALSDEEIYGEYYLSNNCSDL